MLDPSSICLGKKKKNLNTFAIPLSFTSKDFLTVKKKISFFQIQIKALIKEKKKIYNFKKNYISSCFVINKRKEKDQKKI